MTVDDELRTLAERQHGVVGRAQARTLGVSRRQIASRVASGTWEEMTPRVLRLVGAPRSALQLAMAAVLDAGPGAVLGRTSAGALWGLPGMVLTPLVCSRERGRSGSTPVLARLHRPRYLPQHHLTELQGIPVPILARLLFDLAGCLHPARMARLVDTVCARSPSVLAHLHELLPEMAAHGRDGIALMRGILAERPLGIRLPESALERRFEELVRPFGIHLRRQVDVGGTEWLGRIDFIDELWVLYEVDSQRFHLAPSDRARDEARDAALLAAGFRAVVRIPEEDVFYRPERVISTVLAARRRAAAA